MFKKLFKLRYRILSLLLIISFLLPSLGHGQDFQIDDNFFDSTNTEYFSETYDEFENNYATDNYYNNEFEAFETAQQNNSFGEDTEYISPKTDFDFSNVSADVFPDQVYFDWSDMTALDGEDMDDMGSYSSSLLPSEAFQNYDAIISNQNCLNFYAKYCNSYTKENSSKTIFTSNLNTWKTNSKAFTLEGDGGNTKYTPSEKSLQLEEIYTVCSNLNTLGKTDRDRYDLIFKNDLTQKNTICLSAFGFPTPKSIDKEADIQMALTRVKSFSQDDKEFCDLSMAGYKNNWKNMYSTIIEDNSPEGEGWWAGILKSFSFWNILKTFFQSIFGFLIQILNGILLLLTSLFVTVAEWLGNVVPKIIAPDDALKSLSGLSGYTVNNELVVYLWTLIRNLSNVFIVFALLYIAIMIMFKKKEYTNFFSLVYLIVVALIINFTLVLCGVFVDISNLLTTMLLTSGGEMQLGSSFKVVLNTIYSDTCSAITNTFIQVLTAGITTMLVALVLITIFAGLLVMLIVRILLVWFYVAISPAAAVSYILPNTQEYFKKWIEGFSTQLISLPLLAGALTIVHQVTLYVTSLMTITIQNGVEDRVFIVLFTTIIIVAMHAFLLNIFNTLQKGGITSKILNKIGFPLSAKSFFSKLGQFSTSTAVGLGGAAITSTAGRKMVNNMVNFTRNKSRLSKFGKIGNMLGAVQERISHSAGDFLQSQIDSRDSVVSSPVKELSSKQDFARYVARKEFARKLNPKELLELLKKYNELKKEGKVGIETEIQLKALLTRTGTDHFSPFEKKAVKEFNKASLGAKIAQEMSGKNFTQRKKSVDKLLSDLANMDPEDYDKINFATLNEGLTQNGVKRYFMEKIEGAISNDTNFSKLLFASTQNGGKKGKDLFKEFWGLSDNNNWVSKFEALSKTYEKFPFSHKDISMLTEGINTLSGYISELDPGDTRTKELKKIYKDSLNSLNRGHLKKTASMLTEVFRSVKPIEKYNAAAHISIYNQRHQLFKDFPRLYREFVKVALGDSGSIPEMINTKDPIGAAGNKFNQLFKSPPSKKQKVFYNDLLTDFYSLYYKILGDNSKKGKGKKQVLLKDFKLGISPLNNGYDLLFKNNTSLVDKQRFAPLFSVGLLRLYNPNKKNSGEIKSKLFNCLNYSLSSNDLKQLSALFVGLGEAYKENPKKIIPLLKEYTNTSSIDFDKKFNLVNSSLKGKLNKKLPDTVKKILNIK